MDGGPRLVCYCPRNIEEDRLRNPAELPSWQAQLPRPWPLMIWAQERANTTGEHSNGRPDTWLGPRRSFR